MSSSGQADFDDETSRSNHGAPYNSKHPIPTIQRYRENRSELESQQKDAGKLQDVRNDESKSKQAATAVKDIFRGKSEQTGGGDPYPTTNRNLDGPGQGSDTNGTNGEEKSENRPAWVYQPKRDTQGENDTQPPQSKGQGTQNTDSKQDEPKPDDQHRGQGKDDANQSATEAAASHNDPRKKRKAMKHTKRDGAGREVTDPVTHLPIVIRDSTTKDLNNAPENEPAYGSEARTATGLSGADKGHTQLDSEGDEMQKDHRGMRKLFPPPAFDDAKSELTRTYQFAITVGLSSVLVLAILPIMLSQLLRIRQPSTQHQSGRWSSTSVTQHPTRVFVPLLITVIVCALVGAALITAIRGWLDKKVQAIWDCQVWDAARNQEEQSNDSDSHLPESVAWLNSLLASVWPLINPDLFTSLADELEDVMQASLPKMIRMVSVDDLGQGSEAIRILGVRWLPTGAASQTVDDKGNLVSSKKNEENDRRAPGEGEVESDDSHSSDNEEKDVPEKDKQKRQQDEQEKEAMRQGMEAEQGDFVNMELAFAYHARSSGKSLTTKAHNAHLYLKFYFPGGIVIPVWVELRAIIGTMRLRLQLTPDPPFFSLCTLTFLGQPKADLSCVPLSKHSLNVMDVPLISGFVQSAIDAALAEYVAPKSLTLDLKDMLVGDDFKKDTNTRGVVAVHVKSAIGFKEGDGGFGPFDGSSDGYVTVSWGKFSKTIASTRIIVDDQKPSWDEWFFVLVGPDELNAGEKLRLQLWDSDKYTADDDLGRVEVELKELMNKSETKGRMCDRQDRFTEQDPDEDMPGTLSWSVGYFAKTRITDLQMQMQTEDRDVKTKEDLKKQISERATKKLREATNRDEGQELEQQKEQDYKEQENLLVISSPPDPDFPSGVLSIQIHNITGLEVERLNKRQSHRHGGVDHEGADDANEEKDMPSSYCSIILNHQNIYKTRTKPKNSKPFFNAGTERFIQDWQTAEIIVSVRDSREGENDALLGVIYLPLSKVFERRAQVNELYPLAGGIGFGRARISMVFRSADLHLPKELLGWAYGTLEVTGPIKTKSELPDDLKKVQMRLRSNLSREKFNPTDRDGEWMPKHHKKSAFLAVRKRYASALMVEFHKTKFGPDSKPGFAVLWLKDIPDEEEMTVTLSVWQGGKKGLKKARSCADYRGSTDGEKPLGEIELTLKLWRGLSGYHQKWADKAGKSSGEVKAVMEVLDVVSDVEDNERNMGEDDNNTSSSDDSGSDESDGEQNGGIHEEVSMKEKLKRLVGQGDDHSDSESVTHNVKAKLNSHNDPNDPGRGLINQARDYKDHHKQLHARHRGVMQWRPARKLEWMSGKVKSAKGRMEGVFHHGEREPGVETEV